ncbi:hypothetical protein D3C86_1302870 [compost metagenome]
MVSASDGVGARPVCIRRSISSSTVLIRAICANTSSLKAASGAQTPRINSTRVDTGAETDPGVGSAGAPGCGSFPGSPGSCSVPAIFSSPLSAATAPINGSALSKPNTVRVTPSERCSGVLPLMA